jgi:hypothetical protein
MNARLRGGKNMKHKQFGLVDIMGLGSLRETLPPPLLIRLFL